MTEYQLQLQPHRFPGRLIIVEGIDGSGKSTQIRLMQRYLEAQGLIVKDGLVNNKVTAE